MKILLVQDVKGQGVKDEIIDVNDGYAKNFLLPKKLGIEATKAVINEHNQKLAKEEKLRQEEKAKAMEMYKLLNGKTVSVAVKCGVKLYGSVTTNDIAESLKKEGLIVDKKKITIKEPIKSLGEYTVDVWVYKETIAKLKIRVIAQV